MDSPRILATRFAALSSLRPGAPRRGLLRLATLALGFGLLLGPAPGAQGEKKYDPGASDSEIKIGNTMPYSGPASAFGTVGRVQAAYFKTINEGGGVNGRAINYLSQDDGLSPPRTVEQVRKLVEHDTVLFVFSTLGTPTSTAVQRYLNQKKVPQVFVASGATKWGNYKEFPWTIGWQPNYQGEARIYARYILENVPNARIGVLFQNDDYGKDYLQSFKDGLGDKAGLVVAELSYEVTDASIDSQMVHLKNVGANVFFNVSGPKFAAQAIKKAAEIGWRPTHFLNNIAASVGAVLTPAGLDNSKGVISATYFKDPDDPEWNGDPAMKEWRAWMARYYPEGNVHDAFNVFGYLLAQTLVQVLEQCGDELTRENVMKQAANLNDLELSMLLPGIKINTSPTDFYPIEQEQLMRFDGKRWVRFGKILGAR